MHKKKMVKLIGLLGLFGLVVSLLPLDMANAASSGVQFDSGESINRQDPYADTQMIGNIFENKAVYGKMQSVPVDIYKFHADKDGEQSFSLLVTYKKGVSELEISPAYLIIMDPTKANEGQDLGIPTPSDNYSSVVVREGDAGQVYNEPWLLTKYNVAREQKIQLQKDQDYYMLVYDPAQQADKYVVKIGDARLWDAKSIITNFSGWWKVKTEVYAKDTPYHFNEDVTGFLIFILSLAALFGTLLLHEIFSLRANKSKAAAFLLTKIQPFSRLTIWISLWLLAIGAYIYFDSALFTGLPFVMMLLFIPLTINLLYLTIKLSPQLMALVGKSRETVIPLELRKRLFISSIITIVFILAFVVFTAMYFGNL